MIVNDHDEIWKWYLLSKECRASGLGPSAFCRSRDLDYRKFTNMLFRIEYKSRTDPKTYKKYIEVAKEYLASGSGLAKETAQLHNMPTQRLSETVTHLNYLDIIEIMRAKHANGEPKQPEPMQFIQVATFQGAKPRPPILPKHAPEPELIEPKNDIEINISKGVKVCLSPNIDSATIIKIIELLKDL